MPADWCPACGPHFIGRCPHVPIDPAEVRRKVLAVLAHENPAYRESLGACPANHPAACYGRLEQVLAEDPVDGCRWCQTEEWRRRAEGEASRLGSERNALRADLAESQALLALYSGGKAGAVPEGGWVVGNHRFALRRGAFIVNVLPGGGWLGGDPHDVEVDHPGPRPILTACAEALAWLKAREVSNA